MGYSATDDRERGRLRDLDIPGGSPNAYIDFFYIPEEIGDDVTPEYNDLVIVGRSAPIHAYGSTSARALNLEIVFFAEEDARTEVFDKIQWIQSLKYPEYVGKRMKPPHRVSLVIGRFIAFEGIVRQAPVRWQAPFELDTKYPMRATVSLTIEEVVDVPYGYDQVRNSSKIGLGNQQQDEQGAFFSSSNIIAGGA